VQSSLAWRTSSAYLALILVLLLGLAFYAFTLSRSQQVESLEAQLALSASLAAGEAAVLLAQGQVSELQPLTERLAASGGTRVTLIAPDGTVWAESDNDPARLGNHAARPEFIQALRGERGTGRRQSESVNTDLLYVAVPIWSEGQVIGVARAALPVELVSRASWTLIGALGLAVGVAALAATGLAFWLGRTTTEPIKRLTTLVGTLAGGRLDSRLEVTSRDEVGELQRAFNRMADRLEESFGAISSERNRLAAILGTVADGLVITDPESRILEVNLAAERLLGINAVEAIGEPFIRVARDHELAALLERPDGSARLVELGRPRRQVRALAAAIPGRERQRLLLLQDITELRRLETVRRDFVANVSHELRTPLAAIQAIIETLEDGALEDQPTARLFLSRMHLEVDKLTDLVRELLELSRIESGQARLHPESIDLDELLRSVTERLEPLAQRAELTLNRTVVPDLPPALADAERVNQVVASLVHNAVKFTPSGGSINLRAERRANELVVSVADTGMGVPPDDLERIFERFYKTDRSRSGGGTGLGLAIAKHLVQAHGGQIWAESDGSSGTTIRFSLPLAPADSATAARSATGVTWQGS
jgi:two-component system phosphate regulon sensor histidine kinase PhoR